MKIDAITNATMIDACHIVPFSESYNNTIAKLPGFHIFKLPNFQIAWLWSPKSLMKTTASMAWNNLKARKFLCPLMRSIILWWIILFGIGRGFIRDEYYQIQLYYVIFRRKKLWDLFKWHKYLFQFQQEQHN